MKVLRFNLFVALTLICQICYSQQHSYIDILKKKAREMTLKLGNNISLIADKSVDLSLREKLISETILLFKDDQCSIEVSSKFRTETMKFGIREYLLRLFEISSSRNVQIKFSEVLVDSEVKQVEDGSYKVVLRVIQSFKKYNERNVLEYYDITEKSIELFIFATFGEIENEKIDFNNIKFGNMNVIETYNNIKKNTIKNVNVRMRKP
ncbi:MAG: hypothetical protein JNK69_13790 [Saprospiraceae bacterium]|nr:hypothetical protein [Saprospiraceae bacterium]